MRPEVRQFLGRGLIPDAARPKFDAAIASAIRLRNCVEYGTLAQRYVREFDGKWLRGSAPTGEPLVGTADIQSLADLGNSVEVVRGMRWVPFTGPTAMQLALATLWPIVSLTLTMFSLQELLERLLKIVL